MEACAAGSSEPAPRCTSSRSSRRGSPYPSSSRSCHAPVLPPGARMTAASGADIRAHALHLERDAASSEDSLSFSFSSDDDEEADDTIGADDNDSSARAASSAAHASPDSVNASAGSGSNSNNISTRGTNIASVPFRALSIAAAAGAAAHQLPGAVLEPQTAATQHQRPAMPPPRSNPPVAVTAMGPAAAPATAVAAAVATAVAAAVATAPATASAATAAATAVPQFRSPRWADELDEDDDDDINDDMPELTDDGAHYLTDDSEDYELAMALSLSLRDAGPGTDAASAAFLAGPTAQGTPGAAGTATAGLPAAGAAAGTVAGAAAGTAPSGQAAAGGVGGMMSLDQAADYTQQLLLRGLPQHSGSAAAAAEAAAEDGSRRGLRRMMRPRLPPWHPTAHTAALTAGTGADWSVANAGGVNWAVLPGASPVPAGMAAAVAAAGTAAGPAANAGPRALFGAGGFAYPLPTFRAGSTGGAGSAAADARAAANDDEEPEDMLRVLEEMLGVRSAGDRQAAGAGGGVTPAGGDRTAGAGAAGAGAAGAGAAGVGPGRGGGFPSTSFFPGRLPAGPALSGAGSANAAAPGPAAAFGRPGGAPFTAEPPPGSISGDQPTHGAAGARPIGDTYRLWQQWHQVALGSQAQRPDSLFGAAHSAEAAVREARAAEQAAMHDAAAAEAQAAEYAAAATAARAAFDSRANMRTQMMPQQRAALTDLVARVNWQLDGLERGNSSSVDAAGTNSTAAAINSSALNLHTILASTASNAAGTNRNAAGNNNSALNINTLLADLSDAAAARSNRRNNDGSNSNGGSDDAAADDDAAAAVESVRRRMRPFMRPRARGSNSAALNALLAPHTYGADPHGSYDLLLQRLPLLFGGGMSYEALSQLEDVRVPTPKDTIAQMARSKVGEGAGNASGGEPMCSICQCEYVEGETLMHLPCKHCYHEDCVTQWLGGYSKKCPICKAEVTKRGSAATPAGAPQGV